VETCDTCGNDDLMEHTDELGFEGEAVTVCSVCGAVYDATTGDILDDGQA
jgi:nitrite reductase/ring-hydroxylating ferredoxin subunit